MALRKSLLVTRCGHFAGRVTNVLDYQGERVAKAIADAGIDRLPTKYIDKIYVAPKSKTAKTLAEFYEKEVCV